MEQQKKRVKKTPYGYSKKRKKRGAQIFYISLIAIVLIAAIAVACSLLLKISLISITGSSIYSQQEILDACTIKTKDNLVVADTKSAEFLIEEKLPYIKNATITKKFPSKINVDVEPDSAVFAFSQGGVYILLSDDFKVLEIKNTLPENMTVVEGAILLNPIPGKACEYLSVEAKATAEAVLSQMEKCEYDFSKITSISFEDESNVSYIYEDRVKVVLGLPVDLEYKLTFSQSILLNEDGKGLTENDIGIFDISLASDTNRGVFKRLDSLDEENTIENTDDNNENSQPEDTENNENGEENSTVSDEGNEENSEGSSENPET